MRVTDILKVRTSSRIRDFRMIPYLHIGSFALPTFGLMLWLAAVGAAWLLHLNFRRHQVNADALTIVAIATISGIMGAKLWHEVEEPAQCLLTIRFFWLTLTTQPGNFIPDFLDWAKAGFAWFGGLAAGIAALLWQGRTTGLRPLAMLDLCAPSAALGYGIGRIGCHLSGDGDYGVPTHLPWGVSYLHGLVPTAPGVYVHPTPIYEFIVGVALAAFLWWRGSRQQSIGRLTGEYLLFSGVARFLVEFIRINPKVFLGLTNAQLASIASMLAGVALIVWSARHKSLQLWRKKQRRAAPVPA
jgi:phosphatidylglycerol:prolipoprotein diacylglycerol transferase